MTCMRFARATNVYVAHEWADTKDMCDAYYQPLLLKNVATDLDNLS